MEFSLEKEGLDGLLKNSSEFVKTLEDTLSENDQIIRAKVSILGGGGSVNTELGNL